RQIEFRPRGEGNPVVSDNYGVFAFGFLAFKDKRNLLLTAFLVGRYLKVKTIYFLFLLLKIILFRYPFKVIEFL
ncbi:hypothetical protein, partial [Actinobacillus pleuropneumoniae]